MQPTDPQWMIIEAREKHAAAPFVLGVVTTGIYCRPGCPARTPKRENIRIFPLPAAAEAAGFRACKRCHPQASAWANPRAALVQAVCAHIAEHVDTPDALTLGALSAQFHYDASSLQAAFRELLAMSPRQYADALRMRAFKGRMQAGETVTEALFASGYGSTSRVYERADETLGMTPATYCRGGTGMDISYATAPLRFTLTPDARGVLLIAVTPRGICRVSLHDDEANAVEALRGEFPNALIGQDDALCAIVGRILDHVERGAPIHDLAFDIQATAFQWRVWDALRRIPRGETRTYTQIAEAIGQPAAVRAVASACANNHAAIVIPCHRVIGKDGALTGYKWGVARKAAILAEEKMP